MIRRKFMKYAPKEHNDEKVKANLQKHNVPVYEGRDPLKFGQYSNVAKDLNGKVRRTTATPEGGQVAPAEKTFMWQQKALYGGGGGGSGGHDPRNPYAVAQPQGNPYAQQAQGAPAGAPQAGNPYAQDPPAGRSSGGQEGAYGSSSRSAQPYGSSPYGSSPSYGSSQPYDSSGKSYGSSQAYGAPYGGSQPSVHRADPRAAAGSREPFSSEPGGFSNEPYDPEDEYIYGTSKPSSQASQSSRSAPSGQPDNAYSDLIAPDLSGRGSDQPQHGHHHPQADRLFAVPREESSEDVYPPSDSLYSGVSRVPTEDTVDIRKELFGAAPRRMNPDADEFDELNRTTTELERDDDLDHANLDRPTYAPAFGATAELGESDDELNQLPSEYKGPAGTGAAYDTPGYNSGQQLFEDSEDEDVDYVKREIRQTKQDSVESTRRALEIAREAELSGVNALGMLGNQGERLGGSAKTVALGNVQARVGDRNAEELIRLNRSIFIPNISNPFNSRRRNQLKEQRLKGQRAMDELEAQQLEMQQREADKRIAEGLTAAGPSYSETVMRARMRANHDNPERKMYQFEADSDDEALEDELGDNLDEIANATNRLHNLSLKIQEEVDDQDKRIHHMGDRVDTLDLSLLKSTAKMSSIT